MDVSAVAGPAALALVLAGCGILALAHERALPRVTASPITDEPAAPTRIWPRVSIVVPVRDEAHNLPALLRSLVALDYPAFEVIVVDDASTDGTRALAETYAAHTEGLIRVLQSAGPQPGWTGKNAACDLGARTATGDWLLFTDADTEHAPSSLRAAMDAALSRNVHALSLFARQRCPTFWERLLLPFAYQSYFAGVTPRALAAPYGPALANGQYFLIEAGAYAAAGGHAAIAASIVDDVALATALKRAGYPPLLSHGETLVSVRMYDGLHPLVEGFTKNAFQFLREQRAGGAIVALNTACAVAVPGALITAGAAREPLGVALALAAYVAQVAGLTPWDRAFGVPWRYALLGPLAALIFTGIALSSAFHALARRPVRWKGRGYPVMGSGAPTSTATLPYVEETHHPGA